MADRERGRGMVLVFAPAGRDAAMMETVFRGAGISAVVCTSIASLCEGLAKADCAIIAEETLNDSSIARIVGVLKEQPRWSDFPLVILGRPNSSSGDAFFDRLSPVANLTLLERPTRPFTLVTVTRAALRSRDRQHLNRLHLEELLAARAEAERAGRMKDEFLATLSHELRTPLNAIAGWTYMLQRGTLPPAEQAVAIATIDRNAKAQNRLIDELLDMSRIIAGKVTLELRRVDMASLVTEACESVRPTATAKGVALSCHIGSGAGGAAGEAAPVVKADAARLQQAVWNLLTNAIKFTPEGGRVDIEVARRGGRAEIVVSDSGAGIDAAFLPFVFDRFRQADSSTRRRHGGLGLGLSIVKQLVEMHGGTVAVVSRPGFGSAFTIALPLIREPAETGGVGGAGGVSGTGGAGDAVEALGAGVEGRGGGAHIKGPTQNEGEGGKRSLVDGGLLRGVNVLVVDDDEDGRFLLRTLLEEMGATVYSAHGVASAQARLEQTRIDVLLSDLAMPFADGFDLIKWVRASPRAQLRGLPAAAVTAFARAEDRKRTMERGFDAYLSKPVDPQEVLELVQRLRQGPNSSAAKG